MLSHPIIDTIMSASARRREQRRRFLKLAGGTTLAVGSLSLLSACDDDDDDVPAPTPSPSPTPAPGITDADILNLALNLEYLEAQFYTFATLGEGLPAAALTGVGTPGAVTGGRRVNFTDPLVAQYAREIAQDEAAHVTFLRGQLGNAAVAMPAINIDGGATGAFTAAARAAGLIAAGATFDPYANDENFLLAAFLFEDVGVTAYKGAAPLLASKTYLDAAAGILAAEAYHAGLVRTVLYRKGVETPSLRTSADAISNARDSLDGSSNLDEGITGTATESNIVPADGDAIAFSRTPAQVHNIVYLTPSVATSGGFFPAGTNNAKAALRTSGPA